ncbi:MAG: hypothetical protein QOK42_2251 [Frankiaceae bacterium]|jgi:hypothetical protein|nr:hypothetical protein [Frankiaceae bacterium]MDX6226325.1 hypothetical protein [Frankiales bacterium]MDX6273326.1 hypothetical protein [Frankiales bacterium]
MEHERVIRPGAVIDDRQAREVLAELERLDVSRGGVWSGSTSLWQRYDRPWNGPLGARGDAETVGSIFVTYNKPAAYWVTIYRVSITEHGRLVGWTVDQLCDELLVAVGLTLERCPRAELNSAPLRDPFKQARA